MKSINHGLLEFCNRRLCQIGNMIAKLRDKGIKVMENGLFKNRKTGYTVTLNTVIRDNNLSLSANGLYMKINSYISIPDFKVSKSFIFNQCKEGKKAFDNSWKELKSSGYLIQEFHPNPNNRGQFIVTYELLDEPVEDGVHTRYYDIKGNVTHMLYTSYYDSEHSKTNENSEKVNIYESETKKYIHKKEQKNKPCDHTPLKGGMVKSAEILEPDHIPLEDTTLKGGAYNNTIINNTNKYLCNISSSIDIDEKDIIDYSKKINMSRVKKIEEDNKIKSQIKDIDTKTLDYNYRDFLDIAGEDVSVKLKMFLKDYVFNSNNESTYKVSNTFVSKQQFMEHLKLITHSQLVKIDSALKTGKIKSVNGILTFVYNAAYMSDEKEDKSGSCKRQIDRKKSGIRRNYSENDLSSIEQSLLYGKDG